MPGEPHYCILTCLTGLSNSLEKQIPVKGEEKHPWPLIPRWLDDLFQGNSRLFCIEMGGGYSQCILILIIYFLDLQDCVFFVLNSVT